MKRIFIIVTLLLLLVSCSLFDSNETYNSIYILDWMQGAIFVIDSLYNVSTSPFVIAGTSPSDFDFYNDTIYISNSGFGGAPSIQAFDETGSEIAKYEPETATSPACLTMDEDYVYIAEWANNSVLILNRNDLSFYKRIENLTFPYGVLLYDGKLYVGTSSYGDPTDYLYIIDIDDFSVDSIAVGPNPCYMDEYDSKIYISCVGNSFSDINGAIVVLDDNQVEEKVDINGYPGRIKVIDDNIYIIHGYIDQDGWYASDLMRYNKDDFSDKTEYTGITSASDIAKFKEEDIAIGSNSGKVYILHYDQTIDTIEAGLYTTTIRTK